MSRKRRQRPRTIYPLQIAQEARQESPVEDLPARPRTRADCVCVPRPCPWVGCRYHLALDVTEAGSIKLNHPDIPLEDLCPSCSLDVADGGELVLEQVAIYMNLTRERIRQIEIKALQTAKGRFGTVRAGIRRSSDRELEDAAWRLTEPRMVPPTYYSESADEAAEMLRQYPAPAWDVIESAILRQTTPSDAFAVVHRYHRQLGLPIPSLGTFRKLIYSLRRR